MDNKQLQIACKEATKASFGRKKSLTCRTKMVLPYTAERELQRVVNAYTKMIRDELKKRLPELIAEYKKGMRKDARYDDMQDLIRKVRQITYEIANKMSKRFERFRLEEKIKAIAEMGKNVTLREWKRAVKQTVGIDLLDDYYNAGFYEEYIRRWVDENVSKIKSIPEDLLVDVEQTVLEGFRNGETITNLQKAIQREYNISKSAARLIARDQMATLNAQISQAQQRDAGVTRYEWSTSGDSRVRDCHRALNGKIFSWDDPPEMWYETKSRGRIYTGRRCHPGEDICCRCVALPVFDFETLGVPISKR